MLAAAVQLSDRCRAELTEEALRILYQRKAFREETVTDEEHYPDGKPPPPPRPPEGAPHRPKARGGPKDPPGRHDPPRPAI
jgi:hypothetical protein